MRKGAQLTIVTKPGQARRSQITLYALRKSYAPKAIRPVLHVLSQSSQRTPHNYNMIARNFSLRQIVLALVIFGMIGLIVELLLLRHTDSFAKWIPLISLIAGTISASVVAFRPGPRSLRVFQIVMAGFVIVGALGLYFHFRGNVEFALERSPSASGFGLIWKALTGATPTLAPGAMAQLGLFGLAYAYRHPAAGNRSTEDAESVK